MYFNVVTLKTTGVVRLLLLCLMLLVGIGVSAQTEITSLGSISPTGNYKIVADIDASSFSTISSFSGTLEAAINPETHMPYRITNLSAPLFNILAGTVKNLVIESVAISGHTGNTGAIACTANGAARIYNVGILSGSVGGTGNTGGLVGLLDGTNATDKPRVVNCYSYADITSGTEKGGIVGYNNYASKYNDLRTMVMNCMFYGDIALNNTIAPIYGGLEISNDYNNNNSKRLNNYNYFLYEAPFSEGRHITKYNCALAAERRFLVRFEFYRHLLNSTRELASWYVFGSVQADAHDKMLKWVLDRSVASYPILKEQGKYPSVVNYDSLYTNDPQTGDRVLRTAVTNENEGKDLGTLTVTISESNTTSGGQTKPTGATVTTTSLTLRRTDKDTANFNFNYDKVQLPYYNDVGSGNYTGNRVVTGWKITAVAGGTQGERVAADFTTSTNYDAPYYDFADRDTYAKDLYSISGRVFAQGAYFNVPTGVTSITIEPYWGIAAYLSDACYDRYGYNNNDDLTQVAGQRYTNGNTYIFNGSNQVVYTTAGNALAALTGVSSPTVYDYAVVLVGNYHHHATLGKTGPEISKDTKPFSIMSIDLDQDNEPDYCLIYRSGKNQQISPIRFDFITVPGIVMAHKMTTHGDLGIPGNCTPRGWFEITTTGLIKYGQFEHSFNGKSLAPVIFMGGVIEQFVANNTGSGENYNNKTKYMLFGDNVWFKMLSNGAHMDKQSPTPHRPISITGGEFESLYLSGYFRPDANSCTTGNGDCNAECYIDGGKFGEVAGAGQENISGNITWIIDHADMNSFFGGGLKVVNNGSQITGNINTTIKNSHVTLFCGGPKFGDMAAGKTITTIATDCVFGTYFGAGYGGTSIYRECPTAYNQYQTMNYDFNNWVSSSYDNSSGNSYRGKYTSGKGVACGYEYELFAGSSGNVGRLYLRYASFSLAKCNNVTSTLTDCIVTGNFYGGGSLGIVVGDVTSILNSCTVNGSVYGAGFSASIPSASIMATGGFTLNGSAINPRFNETTGVYEKADLPATTDYTWTHVGSLTNGTQTLTDDGFTVKTTEALGVDVLGSVEGNITLTIGGSSIIGTAGNSETGNVFGGGEESAVKGNTNVLLKGNTHVRGNVYGGGNRGAVTGNTSVLLKD